MKPPLPCERGDSFELGAFLSGAALEPAGIGEPGVWFWVDVDADGRLVGSVGLELAGKDALIRGLAVSPGLRGNGRGTELARFALTEASAQGATRAWCVGRASGFSERLGFAPVGTSEATDILADTHLVRSLAASGLLRYETAWSRPLPAPPA
jgi:GNAT superfamily N-acetyltransferase